MSEVGFRYNFIQPVFIFDYFDATQTDNSLGDYMGIYGGLNYWIFTHAASVKLNVGAKKLAKDEWKTSLTLQAQLIF